MILVTVDFMHQVFLAKFANYTLPSFLQPSTMFVFFLPAHSVHYLEELSTHVLPPCYFVPPLFYFFLQLVTWESRVPKTLSAEGEKVWECLISRTKKSQNPREYTKILANLIQWNLSKVDTYGTEVFVHFREFSALEGFELKSSQI